MSSAMEGARGGSHSWSGHLLAAVAGLCWAFCFGRQTSLVAPWIALVPLFLLLGGRRPVWHAFIHGTCFWLGSLYWIPATLVTFGKLPVPLSYVGLLALATFLSLLFWIPFGLLGQKLWRRGGWRAIAGLPALWVALEWLREYLFSGFPWNPAAVAVVDVPGALPLAAGVGAYGVSFLVVLVNGAIAVAVTSRDWRPAIAVGGTALGLLVVGVFIAPESEVGGGQEQRLALLQPNIPNLTDWDSNLVERNYRKMMANAEANCQPGTLLIFPESGLWPYEYGGHPFVAEALDRLAERGCPTLVNSILSQGKDQPYLNTLLLVGREGIDDTYAKRHLVPFGEYVPFRGILPAFDKLARMAGDFAPGDDVALLQWGEHELAGAICYEVTYPTSVAAQVRAGATALVTVTNDAWYGDTSAPWQHLRSARYRAAESRRALLRAAITGVSAVVGPDGGVISQLGVGEEGALTAAVAPRRELTPYVRAPWLVPLACALLALLAYAKFSPARSD